MTTFSLEPTAMPLVLETRPALRDRRVALLADQQAATVERDGIREAAAIAIVFATPAPSDVVHLADHEQRITILVDAVAHVDALLRERDAKANLALARLETSRRVPLLRRQTELTGQLARLAGEFVRTERQTHTPADQSAYWLARSALEAELATVASDLEAVEADDAVIRAS